jgi:hypothetical protein
MRFPARKGECEVSDIRGTRQPHKGSKVSLHGRGRRTCVRRWTTPTASATARRFIGPRACLRESGRHAPERLLARNVVLSFQEDAIGRLRDVIGTGNMMSHSESTIPAIAQDPDGDPRGRAGGRTGQNRRRQHRPRLQFRRADRPCLKSRFPSKGQIDELGVHALPTKSRASSPGSTRWRPWPGAV